MTENGIRHIKSTPYDPSTIGCAEPAVKSFTTDIKKVEQTSSNESLETRLQRFFFAYQMNSQSNYKSNPSKAANES